MQTLGIGSVNRFGAGRSVDDSGMEWLFGVSVLEPVLSRAVNSHTKFSVRNGLKCRKTLQWRIASLSLLILPTNHSFSSSFWRYF